MGTCWLNLPNILVVPYLYNFMLSNIKIFICFSILQACSVYETNFPWYVINIINIRWFFQVPMEMGEYFKYDYKCLRHKIPSDTFQLQAQCWFYISWISVFCQRFICISTLWYIPCYGNALFSKRIADWFHPVLPDSDLSHVDFVKWSFLMGILKDNCDTGSRLYARLRVSDHGYSEN